MWALSQRAHDLGVTVAIAPGRHDATGTVAMTHVPLGSTPLLMVETPTLRPVAAFTKAAFDRVVSALSLVLLAPVFAAIAAVIAVSDGRPVLFRQTRVGRYGELFGCWKFRTMCPNAESQLIDLQHRNDADGLLFKLKDDPRTTAVGRFLRATPSTSSPALERAQRRHVHRRPPTPVALRGGRVRHPHPPPRDVDAIEPEIVARADALEVVRGVEVPVATTGDLIAPRAALRVR